MIYVLMYDTKPHGSTNGRFSIVFDDLNLALRVCKDLNAICNTKPKPLFYWLVAVKPNTGVGALVKSSLSITTHIKQD